MILGLTQTIIVIMYSARQSAEIRQQFWISLGQYLAPVPSASGSRISWLNYHTGIRNLFFRMHADSREAYLGVETEHQDPEIRRAIFARFRLLSATLIADIPLPWHWEEEAINVNGKSVSRIFIRLENVNILDKQCWPSMISFFKSGILALDRFWFDNFEFFESFK